MKRSLLIASIAFASACHATHQFPSVGSEKARVTMLAFMDYQCPFAKRASPTLDALMAKYGEDQLRIVYRNLPIERIHQEARPAAIAALCANAQGRFKRMHDGLFTNYKDLSRAVYLGLAQDDGLDMPAFEACLDSPESQRLVDFDLADARALRVNASPTFLLTNGGEYRKIVDAQPQADFEKVIDELIASAPEAVSK